MPDEYEIKLAYQRGARGGERMSASSFLGLIQTSPEELEANRRGLNDHYRLEEEDRMIRARDAERAQRDEEREEDSRRYEERREEERERREEEYAESQSDENDEDSERYDDLISERDSWRERYEDECDARAAEKRELAVEQNRMEILRKNFEDGRLVGVEQQAELSKKLKAFTQALKVATGELDLDVLIRQSELLQKTIESERVTHGKRVQELAFIIKQKEQQAQAYLLELRELREKLEQLDPLAQCKKRLLELEWRSV